MQLAKITFNGQEVEVKRVEFFHLRRLAIAIIQFLRSTGGATEEDKEAVVRGIGEQQYTSLLRMAFDRILSKLMDPEGISEAELAILDTLGSFVGYTGPEMIHAPAGDIYNLCEAIVLQEEKSGLGKLLILTLTKLGLGNSESTPTESASEPS